MEPVNELIIQKLIAKLDLIKTSNEVKSLYYQKIKLLETNLKISEYSVFDYNVSNEIKLLNKELDNLISSSNNNTFINDKRKEIKQEEQTKRKLLSRLKIKLISYLLTLSIIITSSLYIIDSEKKKTKEVLFNTYNYIYYDESNVYENTSNYLNKTDKEALYIKRFTPWEIYKTQAKRKVYIYKISNMTIEEILNSGDFDTITKNLEFTTENEYKYRNELRDYDRYEEPIYKVEYQTQDHNDYIIRYPHLNSKRIALLLCNLLIYMLIIDINNGPLIESLLVDIKKLKDSDKQLKIDYQIIKSLKKIKRIDQ